MIHFKTLNMVQPYYLLYCVYQYTLLSHSFYHCVTHVTCIPDHFNWLLLYMGAVRMQTWNENDRCIMTLRLPATAAGTVLFRAVTVAAAISWGVYLVVQDWPAVTIFGFNSVPSRNTWWSFRALYTAARTVSVTFCARSKSWSPSGNTCKSNRM